MQIPVEIEEMFDSITLGLIKSGWKHYSSDAILHRIRWHYQVEQEQSDFKCCNNWTSALSRKFNRKYPEHVGFFTLRELRNPKLHGKY